MKIAVALAAAALVGALPSASHACEAPGRPCPAVEVCDTPDCDAPDEPFPATPPPEARCDAPSCDAAPKATCEAAGCGTPESKEADPPAEPGRG